MPRTMNIEILHDHGSARSIQRVDVITRIYVDMPKGRRLLAVHKNPFGYGNPVLADYTTAAKLTELSVTARALHVKPDYKSLARHAFGVLVEEHGAEKVQAALDAKPRIN